MMGTMATTKRTKAPGRNVKEAERTTVAVKLRLEPDTATDLAEFASRAGKTKSEVVDAAMAIVYRLNEGDLSKASGQDVYAAFMLSLHGE